MTRPHLAALLSIAIVPFLAQSALASERPRAIAVRATGPLTLDGVLDEPDWERAPPIGPFRLILVREGEAPSESTDVRVLFTDTHIWFGIRCLNEHAGRVRASLAPRDHILDDDHVAVHLDTYLDRHRAYIFGVNPHGVQLDGILDGGDPDFGWDASWDAETKVDDHGWTAEMAIPLRALRFPEGADAWGLWIRRQITKNDEVCAWPLYRVAVAGDIMLQAGDLEGLTGLHGGGGFVAQPYAASTRAAARSFDAPGAAWTSDDHQDVGLDVRYGVTSTLTANVTLNPDYSQVEADALQIDVNQRFPLDYPEKRPFFLEGAETFSTHYQLVYTRRIADPAYGGKVIGRVGRFRVGAIAVRDDGGGSLEGIGAGSSSAKLSGAGVFTIGRLAYDLGENQKLGLLVTDHVTTDPRVATPAGLARPSSHNAVISVETRLRLAKSLFLHGQIARSVSRLDTLLSLGRGRPVGHLADLASTWTFEWNDGTRRLRAGQDYIGSRFRADAGFFERVDARDDGYEATVTFRPENRWIRSLAPTSSGDDIRDTRGALLDRHVSGAVLWGLQGQTALETRITHVREVWLGTPYDRWRTIAAASNSLWRPLAFGLDATFEDGIFYGATDSASFLGWQETWHASATARPSPRLTSELSATRSRFLRARGGALVYDLWLLGAKTTYQFDRRLFVRVYPQYDTDTEHLDADALMGYVVHPGSVLYAGVNGGFDRVDDRRRATRRSVFLKASYAFQG